MRISKQQYYWAIGVALLMLFLTLTMPQKVFEPLIIPLVIIWWVGLFVIGIYQNRNTEKDDKPNYDAIIYEYEKDKKNKYKPTPKEVEDAYEKTGRKPRI